MHYLPVVIDAEYIADYTIRVTFDNEKEKIMNKYTNDRKGRVSRGY